MKLTESSNHSFKKVLKGLDIKLKNISKRFPRELKADIEASILEEITQGRSPVNHKRFKPYSNSYAKIKGYKKPVDMTVTGKMLRSLRAFQIKDGTLRIMFGDIKATYHNLTRRLLPIGKETFKRKIMRVIRKAIKRAIKKGLR